MLKYGCWIAICLAVALGYVLAQVADLPPSFAEDAEKISPVHECFISVPQMIEKFKFTQQSALAVGTQIHTAPEAFGKIMSRIEPRMAVAYHFFNDYDTSGDILTRIPYSDLISGGKLDMRAVIQPIYDETNKTYGINEKQDE